MGCMLSGEESPYAPGLPCTGNNVLSRLRAPAQGIETVRRDNCQLVRTVVSTCLDKILIEEDIEGAKEYVRNTISDLLMNRLDLSLLVITKANLSIAEQQRLPNRLCNWLRCQQVRKDSSSQHWIFRSGLRYSKGAESRLLIMPCGRYADCRQSQVWVALSEAWPPAQSIESPQ